MPDALCGRVPRQPFTPNARIAHDAQHEQLPDARSCDNNSLSNSGYLWTDHEQDNVGAEQHHKENSDLLSEPVATQTPE